MRNKEQLKELINIIIPDIYFESKNSFYQMLDKSFENPKSIIDTTDLKNGFWGLQDYTSDDFKTLIILDGLTEGFIERYNSNEIEELWSKLSVVLNCRNLQKLRNLIDYEIYDNKTVDYTFSNSSIIFKDTDFKVVEMIKNDFTALTILSFEELEAIQKLQLGISIRELNKNAT